MGFWDEPQGAAIFKHAVLDEYAPIFASKTGQFSPGHRVDILDGYAGRGWYKDGSPGSPARMLKTAQELAKNRNIRCWFVEEDQFNFKALSSGLVKLGADPASARALHGTMSERLPEILAEAAEVPLFAFIDPFGIGLPFEQLVGDLMRRSQSSRPATEVLINFVYAGIYRNAGQLQIDSDNPSLIDAASSKVRGLDENLGGTWWHQIQREARSTEELVLGIEKEYVRRVLAAAGPTWRCMRVQVADSMKGRPIYDLLLFSQHPQGPWFFNDAVSLARRIFQTYCEDSVSILQPPLWEPETEWVSAIKSNLRSLMTQGRPFKVIDEIENVYGTVLGVARGVHVKRAAKALSDEGLNAGDCRPEPHRLIIKPSPPPAAVRRLA